MGFNLAILISGRGSNMLNIVDACNNKNLSSKVKIIITNNKNSTGLAKVKKKGIKTKIINENQMKKFEKKLSQILLALHSYIQPPLFLYCQSYKKWTDRCMADGRNSDDICCHSFYS